MRGPGRTEGLKEQGRNGEPVSAESIQLFQWRQIIEADVKQRHAVLRIEQIPDSAQRDAMVLALVDDVGNVMRQLLKALAIMHGYWHWHEIHHEAHGRGQFSPVTIT